MTSSIQVEDEHEVEEAYEAEVGQIRDKAATLELVQRNGSQAEAAIYAMFDEILNTCHDRLLMNPVTRKLGPGGQAPTYRVAMRSNLHGDEGTGRVDRVVVVLCKEADYLEHGYSIRFEVNEKVWNACVEAQQRFVVDEAWETVRADLDKQGRQRLDEHGRRVFLKGKPDVRVFSNVVQRHGAAFVEVERVSRVARESKVQHQQSFDFREIAARAAESAPAPPPAVDHEQIREDEVAKAKAKREAMRKV
jgi:hypothetical protein